MVDCYIKHSQVNGGLAGALDRLRGLQKRQILVGIPAEKSSRPKEPINNAELLYIHTHGIRKKEMRDEMNPKIQAGMRYSKAYELYIMEHGSPLWHAPPRPVLEPAIQYNKDKIMFQFKTVIRAASRGDIEAEERAIHRTGMQAQNACRKWFKNPANNWPPNSPLTIKLKKSDRPLVDTGTLRKSIIYVVRNKP